jgi:hypothetical protein
MKYTLTALKIYKAMSQETVAYSATLNIDGKPAFECRNHGHGGADTFQRIGDYRTDDIEAAIKADPPAGVVLSQYMSPLESLITRLIQLGDAEKLLKSITSRAFVFIEDGKVKTISPKRGQKATQLWFQAIQARHPELTPITRDHGWDEAIQILCPLEQPEP